MSETMYIERYWRDAKPEDAIKEPPMVARFRDSIDCNSAISIWSEPMHLVGWDRTDNMNWCNGQCWWKFCQVYDAPDPGEGYRLIDVDKDDFTDKSIEVWNESNQCWEPRLPCNQGTVFGKYSTYRRRITPTVTYVPFVWEDREQVRGRWVYRDKQELQLVDFDNSDGFHANGVHVENLCKYWKFIDTGEPVGKKVTQ